MPYFQRVPWFHTADPRGSDGLCQYFTCPTQATKSFWFLPWVIKEEISLANISKQQRNTNTEQFCREDTRTHPKSVLLWFVGHSDRWGGTHFIITDWNQNIKDRKLSVAPTGLPRHQHIPTAVPGPRRFSSPLREAAAFCLRRHKSTIREFPLHTSRENTDQHYVDVVPASQMRNIWVPGVLE